MGVKELCSQNCYFDGLLIKNPKALCNERLIATDIGKVNISRQNFTKVLSF